MKKMLSLLCVAIILTVCILPAAAMTVDNGDKELPSEDIDPNGLVVYEGDRLVKADPFFVGEIYEIRDGTRSIAPQAFKDCERLEQIVIPDTVERIGKNAFLNTAFSNCPENWRDGLLIASEQYLIKTDPTLVECHVPFEISVIADGAFEASDGITDLRYISLSSRVKSLHKEVFQGLTRDVEVYYSGTLAQFMRGADFPYDDINLVTTNTRVLLRITCTVAATALLYTIVLAAWNRRKKTVE